MKSSERARRARPPPPSGSRMRPSRIRTTRWAALGDRRVVRDQHDRQPLVSHSVCSSATMPSPVAESRLPVGSSASSTRGALASARAIATRCCSPPESWEGRCSARAASPTRSSSSRRAPAPLGALEAPRRQRRLDVLDRGQRRDQVELLEDEPERVAPQARELAVAHRHEVLALELDAPARRAVERAEQLQQRRLARAGRPGDDEELAVANLEVDAVDRRDVCRSASRTCRRS